MSNTFAIESSKFRGWFLNWSPADQMCEWGAYMNYEGTYRKEDRTHTLHFENAQKAQEYCGKISRITSEGWAGVPVQKLVHVGWVEYTHKIKGANGEVFLNEFSQRVLMNIGEWFFSEGLGNIMGMYQTVYFEEEEIPVEVLKQLLCYYIENRY